ncbi:DUF7535 family protein [Haloarchaeobius sp. HRN-SO-5]|uniref:DUF7535 family protein n=1 Tax=Haloarchaeobius sp. HRN-SO-5 TaxID=3446118 RepID=UPI003EBBB0AD
MSAEAQQEESTPSALPEPLRTVTPPYFGREDAEMSVIGWAVFGLLVAILFPFLPLLIAIWAVSKVAEALGNR